MLADSDLEPLVLADGTKINPTTGKAIKEKPAFVEVPSGGAAQALVLKARKTVAELPLPPQQLSGVALVAFYSLFGLPDEQIAIALEGRITVEQVKNIKLLDAYKTFMDTAKANIIDTSADVVRDMFQQRAVDAASKVIELAASDNDVLAFKASQDVLDRAGHRPADIVEHKHSMTGGLEIVITRKDETEIIPTIDLTPEDVSYVDSN